MSRLIASDLNSDRELNQHIDSVVSKVSEYSQRLKKICESSPELKKQSDVKIEEIGSLRGRPLFYPYVGSGIGSGPYVELEDGSVKIDLINGIGVHILGHSHPQILKSCLKASIQDVVIQGHLQANDEYFLMKKKLVEIAQRSSRLRYVWLTTSGSMANENALKACRQKKSPASMIIALNSAFAGRTTMMAEITDNPSFKQGLPSYDEVLRVPPYDKSNSKSAENSLRALKEHVESHKDKICTFTFEPIQGEGGFRDTSKEFFLPMLDFCKSQGIPVWVDEIQTFCRTGEFFAFKALGLGDYIDICTVAKSLQNAATFFTSDLNPKPGLISGTFAGSTVSLSAGLKVLDILDNGNYMGPQGQVIKIHNQFRNMLDRLSKGSCKGLISEIEGMGLMIAFTPLDGTKKTAISLLKTLFKNGMLTFSCGHGPVRIRFLLPAILTEEDISISEKILEKSLLEITS